MNEEINPLTGLPYGTAANTGGNSPISDPQELNPLTGKPYSGAKAPTSISGSTTVPKIHEQVRLLGSQASYMNTDSNYDLAVAQGVGEEVARGTVGFGKNAAAGFLDALGVTIDPEMGMNIVGGVDEHFNKNASNAFTKLAESIREEDGSNTIYTKEGEDSFNPGDSAWWSNMFKQSGTSVGIMVEALVETAAASYLTGGLSTVLKLGKVGGAAKVISAADKANKAQKNAMAWAGFRRYSESLIEAKDNGIQTYNEYIRAGKTDEEASKAASEVSRGTFIGNMPLLAFDLVSAGTMSSVASAKTTKGLFDLTKSGAVNKGINIGVGMVSEGSEELFQELVNEEAKYRVDLKNGFVKPNSDRFLEYAKSGKAWNAFASGVFGSVVLGPMSKGIEAMSGGAEANRKRELESNWMRDQIGSSIETIKDIDALEKDGKFEEANVHRQKLGVQKALLALRQDDAKGTNMFEAHLEYLNDIENSSEEELKEMGLTPDLVKKYFPGFKEDALSLQKIFNEEKKNDNGDFLEKIVQNRFLLEGLGRAKTAIDTELSNLKIANQEFDGLSLAGKERIDLEVEREAIAIEYDKVESQKEMYGEEYAQKRREELNTRLGELNTEIGALDNYTAKDNEIIAASNKEAFVGIALRQKNVETAQGFTRGRIAELKNKDFQKKDLQNRIETDIENSKSVDALSAIKAKLESLDKLDNTTEEKINAKIKKLELDALVEQPIPTEVEAVEDAGEVKADRKGIATSTVRDFNKPTAKKTNQPKEDITVVAQDQLFDALPIAEINEEQLATLKKNTTDYVASLERDLGYQPSFEEYIRDHIKHVGKTDTDQLYDVLVKGWLEAGFAKTDFDKVYRDVFRSRAEIAASTMAIGREVTRQDLDTQIEGVNKTLAENSSIITSLDENNQPVKTPIPLNTVGDGVLTAGYLSIAYQMVEITDENGNKKLVREDISTVLNTSDVVNSQKILNPDRFNAKEKLNVAIPPNYLDINIQVFDETTGQMKSMPFRNWMEENNIEFGSDEWKDNVPMLAYDTESEPVFYIHDVSWYNPVNITEEDPIKKEKTIEEGKQNVRNLRRSVNEGQSVEIEIVDKKGGRLVKIPMSQEMITLNQADPTLILAIGDSKGDLIDQDGKKVDQKKIRKQNGEVDIFENGFVYQLRKVGENEWMPLYTTEPKLSPEIKSTIKQAITAHFYQNDTSEKGAESKKLIDAIYKETGGIDISRVDGLQEFLQKYIRFTGKSTFTDNTSVSNFIKNNTSHKEGVPFFSLQNKNFVFGIKGQELAKGQDFLYMHPYVFKKGEEADPAKVAVLELALKSLDAALSAANQNVSRSGLAENTATVLINDKGEVTSSTNYREFIKDTLQTNVRGFNLPSNDATPVYATLVQPTITFRQTGQATVSSVAPQTIKEQVSKEQALLSEEKVNVSVDVEGLPEQEIATLRETIEALKMFGFNESSIEIQITRQKLGEESPLYDIELSESDVEFLSEDSFLTIRQEFQIVDYIFNKLSAAIGFDKSQKVNRDDLLTEIQATYENVIGTKQTSNTNTLVNLKQMINSNPELNSNLKVVVDSLEKEVQIYSTIKDNWGSLENKAMEKLSKYTGIQEVERIDYEEIGDQEVYNEKDYSKSYLEESGKNTASYRLKRFFASVLDKKLSNEQKRGFLGVELYKAFDEVYETIGQILSSPNATPSDFNLMMVKLKENIPNKPWLAELITRLENSDQRTKNEFVYNFTKDTLSMKFMMYSTDREGNTLTQVYDTNSTEVNRVISKQWEYNFNTSDLVYADPQTGVHKVSIDRANYLIGKFKAIQEKVLKKKSEEPLDIKEIIEWTKEFGIELSEDTIKEMIAKPTNVMTPRGMETLTFPQMFLKGEKAYGVFGLLGTYLDHIITQEDTSYEDIPANHPFDNMTNALKTLTRIESKYSQFTTSNSFRDGDKTIYGFTPTKHATDISYNLKFDQDFRDSLLDKEFNKNSLFLQMLNSNEPFRDKFGLDHLGITALKEMGQKVFGDNSISDLSNADHEYLKLGMFQDMQQGETNYTVNKLKMRMARVLFPTMSDKSQMLAMHTAVLDLSAMDFFTSEGQVTGPKMNVLETLYSQIVQPDLDRIYDYLSKGEKTNIKGYDLAAQMFMLHPELNAMTTSITNATTGVETKESVLGLIIRNSGTYNKQWFEETQKAKAIDLIKNSLDKKATEKVQEWKANGFLKQNGENEKLNSKYMANFNAENAEARAKMAAYDYIINSRITNANFYMMFAGDPALYATSEMKSFFNNGEAYSPKTPDSYLQAIKVMSDKNLGKRLAAMIAPGSKIANSKGDTYTQIFLEDFKDISTNIPYLVSLFYEGAKNKTFAESKVKEFRATENEDRRAEIIDELGAKFPMIAEYLDLEATDAQEYTTVKEHLDVLFRQGRLDDDIYASLMAKYNNQLKGKENSKFTKEELAIVMQPIKPVYTGFVNDKNNGVMRMVYIKSSSFPLLPQVTGNTELDKLRVQMESLEKSSGKNVRASYGSANKLGSINKPILPFDKNGRYRDVTAQELSDSSMTLSREGFRIQQDVPVKNKDLVSMGTQTLKLLFGDGITALDGFVYNGESYTGKDLLDGFNKEFGSYINLIKETLFKELGVNPDGTPLNVKESAEKLQALLQSEAKKRGYPKQDVDALNLIYKVDVSFGGQKLNPKHLTKNFIEFLQEIEEKGLDNLNPKELEIATKRIEKELNEKIDILNQGELKLSYKSATFTNPLWMSPNSNRYESLLNAIVSNKLSKIKLPGRSLVAGSEAGFKTQTNLTGVDTSKVVYTKSFTGELLGMSENNKTQVLLPQIFRDNEGKIINLASDKYSVVVDGVRRLREDMIDMELLNMTSFRIPTSSHVSMSQIEVVGFLPAEAGDLVIVPKNLTKQKGLDFDIDKETIYKLWTQVDQNGKVRPLTEEDRGFYIKKVELDLRKENKITEDSKKVLSYFVDEDNVLLKDLLNDTAVSLEQKLDRLNTEFTKKLHENNLVKMHSSVLSNSNKEVQKKINKVLSMDFARGQAKLIDEAVNAELESDFSFIDDTYQKEKMFLGAAGKLGIGVYSNYVVFNSLVQQMENPIKIRREYDKELEDIEINIGGILFDGQLGRLSTLGPRPRDISEIFAERQNTATDNEKEQIMGKVNINDVTINVDSMLALMGYDKGLIEGNKEVSIPYLLLSQPIIKEYVAEIKKAKSNITEFDSKHQEKIIERLEAKYGVNAPKGFKPEDKRQDLTAQELFNQLSSTTGGIQLSVLDLFLEVDRYATTIGKLQKTMSIGTSGLGKSFFDTVDKHSKLETFVDDYSTNLSLQNVQDLIGDFVKAENVTNPATYVEDGYMQFGSYFIKPTTAVGSMLVNSVHSGYNLWEDKFPYNDPSINEIMKDIIKMTNGTDVSSTKKVERSEQIFQEMKKYFVSSQRLNLFENNPQIERERLFMDNATNEALATKLVRLMRTHEDLKSNPLLSRFSFETKKDGKPSLIKFDNNKSDNFDEDYLYKSLIDLITENKVLEGTYTTRQLAQDLIAYTYLEGGIQEAIQFTKYVPMSYLNLIGFSETLREWSSQTGMFSQILGKERFLTQYAQHNAEKLQKVTVDKMDNVTYTDGTKLFNLDSFNIKEEDENNPMPKFISVYNKTIKKGLKKFQVYQRIGDTYHRIPTLGVFGMSEYSIRDESVNSIVNGAVVKNQHPVDTKTKVTDVPQDHFNISSLNLQQIITEIAEFNFSEHDYLNPVVQYLKDNVPNDVKVVIKDIVDKDGRRIARGSYDPQTKTITIDTNWFNTASKEDIGKTFIKEFVHATTANYMAQYVNADGSLKVDQVPKEILDLVVLFNETRKHLGSELQSYGRGPTSDREKTVVYGATSIYEFVEVMMTEPNFQKEMEKVTYKESGKSLADKFYEVVNAILSRVLGPNFKQGVTSETIKNIIAVIEKQNFKKNSNKPIDVLQQTDNAALALLGENDNIGLGNPINDQKSEDSITMEPIIHSKFGEFLETLERKNCN